MKRRDYVLFPAIVAGLIAGCGKSEGRASRAAVAHAGLMPGAEPTIDLTYVADQKQVKLLPVRQISYEPLGSAPSSETTPAAAESTGAPTEAAAEIPGAGGDMPGGWLGRLAGRVLWGGESAPGAGGPSIPSLSPARPVVSDVPPNPAGKSAQYGEQARDNGVNAARELLLAGVGAFPTGPGATVAKTAGAESGVQIPLANLQIVGMTWLDGNRLEVEVQFSVGDARNEIVAQYGAVDLGALNEVDAGLCFTAKGVGSAQESGTEPAGPGTRARRAGEGIGI